MRKIKDTLENIKLTHQHALEALEMRDIKGYRYLTAYLYYFRILSSIEE